MNTEIYCNSCNKYYNKYYFKKHLDSNIHFKILIRIEGKILLFNNNQ